MNELDKVKPRILPVVVFTVLVFSIGYLAHHTRTQQMPNPVISITPSSPQTKELAEELLKTRRELEEVKQQSLEQEMLISEYEEIIEELAEDAYNEEALERAEYLQRVFFENRIYETRVGLNFAQQQQMRSWAHGYSGSPENQAEEFEKYIQREVLSEEQFEEYQHYISDLRETEAMSLFASIQRMLRLSPDQKDSIWDTVHMATGEYPPFEIDGDLIDEMLLEILSEDQQEILYSYEQ